MKKLILYIAASMDGFIATKHGVLDWLDHEVELGDLHWDHFMRQIDTVLLGRKTYEQILSFGQWPYHQQQTVVFAHAHPSVQTPNTRHCANDPCEEVRSLKREEGKNIWLVGGGAFNHTLMKAGLIDEIQLFLQPVALGDGIGLFGNQTLSSVVWKLEDCKPLNNGSVWLHYVKTDSQT